MVCFGTSIRFPAIRAHPAQAEAVATCPQKVTALRPDKGLGPRVGRKEMRYGLITS